MRFWLPAALAALTVPALFAPAAHAESYSGLVTRVADTATVYVRLDDGRTVVTRLLGVAPARVGSVDYALKGREYLASRIYNHRVRLDTDTQTHDPQGRLLSWMWLGDTLVNRAIIRDGMALASWESVDRRYASELAQAQSDARTSRTGIWAVATGTATPAPWPSASWRPSPVPAWTPRPRWWDDHKNDTRHDHGKHKGKGHDKGHDKGHGKGHEKHGD
jgi:endonuclease YncB( thermonuclease family)